MTLSLPVPGLAFSISITPGGKRQEAGASAALTFDPFPAKT
jgi:hypothetical protein